MNVDLYINYTPKEVKFALDKIRNVVGPGGCEFSPLVDSKWVEIVKLTKTDKVTTLDEYFKTLLSISLTRDANYTRSSRGFQRALGVDILARKAYQRALLAALNGVTQV